jgi:hypothetical protein
MFAASFFCTFLYFLGSKNNILILVVISGVYYNFYIKRISLLGCLLFLFISFSSILGLLYLQGSYDTLFYGMNYFKDYFNTTFKFISRFDEFGFRYGKGWLSSLWFYVPRGLFPDKPFEYGLTLIHRTLFPGYAALGHTPGSLPWSLAYLD